MLPSNSINDAPNGMRGNAEPLGDLFLGHAGSMELSDASHIVISENSVPMPLALSWIGVFPLPVKNEETMNGVLARRYDFEIASPVVGLDPVDVIDMHPLGDRANEGTNDKTVDLSCYRFPIRDAECNDLIATLVESKFTKPPTLAKHVAEIGYLIPCEAVQIDPTFHVTFPSYGYGNVHTDIED